MNLKIWLKAIRAPFFTATIVPVLLGTAVAWNVERKFNLFYFLLTLFSVLLVHMGTNLANDYFDHKTGNDEINKNPTPFSGGSRVIQDKLLPASSILKASLFSFGIGSLLGLYLVFKLGYIVLLLGAIGVFLGFFYTATPLKLGYKRIGEFLVGIGFGPLVVVGSYYVQTLRFSSEVILISIPIGLLIAMVLWINEFPDYEADAKVGKNTSVVKLGKRKALRVYYLTLGLVYVWVVSGVLFKIFPVFTLLILLTFPIFLKTLKITKQNYEKIYELLPANATTIMLHLSIGIFLTVAYLID